VIWITQNISLNLIIFCGSYFYNTYYYFHKLGSNKNLFCWPMCFDLYKQENVMSWSTWSVLFHAGMSKFGSVRFLSKKLTKIKFWKTKKFKPEPVQTDRCRFGSVWFFNRKTGKPILLFFWAFLGFFGFFRLSNGLVINVNII